MLAGIAVAGYTLGGPLAGLFEAPAAGRLELGQVVVVNRATAIRSVGSSFEQTDDTAPQVDVTVRNSGSAPAWIQSARITVLDGARLPTCLYAGGIGDRVPQSKPYRVTLPELPMVGERVLRRPLHEEVLAGEAYRVALAFQPRDNWLMNHLFAFRVELLTEAPRQVLDVGSFVLAVSDPVTRDGRALPENAEALRGPDATTDRLASTWCFRRNLAEMRRVLAHPGGRSAQTEALERMQLAANWQRFADDTPARAAAEPLLRAEVEEGPVLAAFAAAASGDRELVARTKARASARMLAVAREDLDGRYPNPYGAVLAVRQALALTPSSDPARRLLWRATAARQAQEEELDDGR